MDEFINLLDNDNWEVFVKDLDLDCEACDNLILEQEKLVNEEI